MVAAFALVLLPSELALFLAPYSPLARLTAHAFTALVALAIVMECERKMSHFRPLGDKRGIHDLLAPHNPVARPPPLVVQPEDADF